MSVIDDSLVKSLKIVTVINPITATTQNLFEGFSSERIPANIATDKGTAASTIPPLPAGMVCIATAVNIGNAKTTPIAVIINLFISDFEGKFSFLN